jgi:murein DD-endopeptidase MepM/ murein hydrolase activator NlpD
LDNHDGVDFPAARGTPLYSVGAGRVAYISRSTAEGSLGNYIAIELDYEYTRGGVRRRLIISYGHLDSIHSRYNGLSGDVRSRNLRVSANDIIGYVGDTGSKGAVHLHLKAITSGGNYGNKNYNNVINPLQFFGLSIPFSPAGTQSVWRRAEIRRQPNDGGTVSWNAWP